MSTRPWDINNNNQVNGAIGNAGTVSSTAPATSLNFRGIANLVGGTANDTFKFAPGGFVLGTVNGRGGVNTLDYSSITTPVTLNLKTNTSSGIGQTFASIQSYVGNNAAFDKLIGTDTVNTWSITGVNTGNVQRFVHIQSGRQSRGWAINGHLHFGERRIDHREN